MNKTENKEIVNITSYTNEFNNTEQLRKHYLNI